MSDSRLQPSVAEQGDAHVVVTDGATSIVIDWASGQPVISHLGAPMTSWAPETANRPVPRATLDVDPTASLFTLEANGTPGRPGIEGARPDGTAWAPRPTLTRPPEVTGGRVDFLLADDVCGLAVDVTIELTSNGTVTVTAGLTNRGSDPWQVTRFAPSLPLPAHMLELLTFTGRWAREFELRSTRIEGSHLVANRRGRTSHDRIPACMVSTSGATDETGEVLAAQLAWSGNHELLVERWADGRGQIQAGELFAPGEVVLDQGERLQAPSLVAAWSGAGRNGASQAFHRHVRALSPVGRRGERPVSLNTWEAVYFDHDLDTLTELATTAARVGVERFILDDGWFGDRRDDTAGLGDWTVSTAVWPDGLEPLTDLVTGLGMEFGLWFEPEMVNPDSDLFRSHPEWALTTDGYDPLLGRNQLVLDLGRPEVCDHLFGAIDELLAELPISYVKWDMNRDLVQASGADGRAGTRRHVIGLYGLLDRLREAHPTVEFESCSSGGGRADLGILARTERIWTSDCNDAVERQAIQRGFSVLFPPEVMGAHIGPERAHITQRHQDLGFRTATAFFGHLGIEWNLLEASDLELMGLERAIAEHKRLRPLLHSGSVVRCDHPEDGSLVHGVVSQDRHHAVFAWVQHGTITAQVPASARLAGLDPDLRYHIEVVDLGSVLDFGLTAPAWLTDGAVASGAQLMAAGIQPPVAFPQGALIVELTSA